MSQTLIPAQYYDLKHMTPGSTKIAECSGAMVNTPCPSLLLPLSMSLSTLFPSQGQCSPWHRSRRRDWRQISLFAFRSMTSTGSNCIPKNVRNGGGRAGLEVPTHEEDRAKGSPECPRITFCCCSLGVCFLWGTSHFLIWCQTLLPRVPLKIFTN